MPGHGFKRPFAATAPRQAPSPAAAATDTTEDATGFAGEGAAAAAEFSGSGQIPPPEQKFTGFVFETIVGLQCCCSVGSVRNPDGFWTELLLVATAAHGSLRHDDMGHINDDDSCLSGGLRLGTVHLATQAFLDQPTSPTFRPLPRSNDSPMLPDDLQCHAVDEAGMPLLSQDRLIRVHSL
jgi:hypothetical protein